MSQRGSPGTSSNICSQQQKQQQQQQQQQMHNQRNPQQKVQQHQNQQLQHQQNQSSQYPIIIDTNLTPFQNPFHSFSAPPSASVPYFLASNISTRSNATSPLDSTNDNNSVDDNANSSIHNLDRNSINSITNSYNINTTSGLKSESTTPTAIPSTKKKENPSQSAKKKRVRIPISCSSCRKKKIKCNRKKPCSACSEKKTEHLCSYINDSPFINSLVSEKELILELKDLKSQNELLKLQLNDIKHTNAILNNQITNLRKAKTQAINNNNNTNNNNNNNNNTNTHTNNNNNNTSSSSSALNYYSPNSPNNINSSNDIKLSFENFHSSFQKQNRLIYFGATSFRTIIDMDPFFSKIYHTIFAKTKMERKKFKLKKKKVNYTSVFPFLNSNTKLGLAFDNNLFLKNLLDYLPNYNTLKHYLLKFFILGLHKLFPLITQEYMLSIFNDVFIFIDNNNNIDDSKIPYSHLIPNGTKANIVSFISSPENDFKILIINKRTDFAKIALILLVVKFSLTFNKEILHPNIPQNDDEILIIFIENCLSLSNFMKNTSVTALQALLLLRCHKTYHPDDGDGGDSSNGSLLFSICFNMAIQMGFHRKSEVMYGKNLESFKLETISFNLLSNVNTEEKKFKTKQNIIRMMLYCWFFLLNLDIHRSFDLGYPITFNENFCDNFKFTSSIDYLKKIICPSKAKKMLPPETERMIHHAMLYQYRNIIDLLFKLHDERDHFITTVQLEVCIHQLIQTYNFKPVFIPISQNLKRAYNLLGGNQNLNKSVNQNEIIELIRNLKLQLQLIDNIVTMFNILCLSVKNYINSLKESNIQIDSDKLEKLETSENYYRNQTTNFSILIILLSKRILAVSIDKNLSSINGDLKNQHIFNIYLYPYIKRIALRSSTFLYSNIFCKKKYPRNGDRNCCLLNSINCQHHISNFSLEDFEKICFKKNVFEINIENFSVTKNNLENFRKEFRFYNFHEKKNELNELLFDFFYRTIGENLKNYYTFFVIYRVSVNFYNYLKDKRIFRLRNDNGSNYNENEGPKRICESSNKSKKAGNNGSKSQDEFNLNKIKQKKCDYNFDKNSQDLQNSRVFCNSQSFKSPKNLKRTSQDLTYSSSTFLGNEDNLEPRMNNNFTSFPTPFNDTQPQANQNDENSCSSNYKRRKTNENEVIFPENFSDLKKDLADIEEAKDNSRNIISNFSGSQIDFRGMDLLDSYQSNIENYDNNIFGMSFSDKNNQENSIKNDFTTRYEYDSLNEYNFEIEEFLKYFENGK
ncbi:uncharacterized protein ASCRUDRAFT_67386 [Ascoidea rubescens DSM 1968]|uniref:Zn(2)-C6 fungal-type domain-containing protein n=1 Tax=Ascoidea rubescens DSM 1968 TaxID=1344418 RepID=A0A1D2VNT1_9ASCO|nr:hypothetical protein ASCRUDRAFT_67386 [Ascoidea rubescens DSM 1968]ODV63263.1 hypothetical protein ASCRUDRAFT_67386 [Ascoidea rubescens DSM 1968]